MSETIVKMTNIYKSFPGVKALEDVTFDLKSGEVLALLGENGAGKSTLMKILSGIYAKDKGSIQIDGKDYPTLTPKIAAELGIAIIHQELNMCQHLTVAENMFLGREKTKNGILRDAEMEAEAKKILDDLKIDISPSQTIGELAVSKQQMVEIAKALSLNARILIMDEPTSALTAKEITELFRIIHELKAKGCGIVYISHRLEELAHITDRVTILRDGQYITSMDFADTTIDEIITHMVGREITEQFPRDRLPKGEELFSVKNLNAGPLVRDISFTVNAGEVLGFAGLMGAGRTEMTRAVFGVDPKTSGEIYVDGKLVKVKKPADAIKAGIVLVPEDRKKDGLCTKLSIRHNLALPNLDMLTTMDIINSAKEQALSDNAVERLKIKTHNVDVDAANLSGGNQQKIVIGKWLARDSKIVIFDEPTRGIDVGAKVEIYNIINKLKAEGIGVIVVSSELPELMGISDRIVVMCDGRITGELMSDDATQGEIITLATKFENKMENETSAQEAN